MKFFLSILFVLITSVSLSSQEQVPLSSWEFDEGFGRRVLDDIGTANGHIKGKNLYRFRTDGIDGASDVALKGFRGLVNGLKGGRTSRFGNLYELQVATELFRTNPNAAGRFVTKYADNHGSGKTDIDVVIGPLSYQVKRSKAAFKGKDATKTSRKLNRLNAARSWIQKAVLDGKTTGVGAQRTSDVVYVVPKASDVPTKINDLFTKLGVTVLEIPAKGRAAVGR